MYASDAFMTMIDYRAMENTADQQMSDLGSFLEGFPDNQGCQRRRI